MSWSSHGYTEQEAKEAKTESELNRICSEGGPGSAACTEGIESCEHSRSCSKKYGLKYEPGRKETAYPAHCSHELLTRQLHQPPAVALAFDSTDTVPFIGAEASGSGTFVMVGDTDVFDDRFPNYFQEDGNAQFARNLCP